MCAYVCVCVCVCGLSASCMCMFWALKKGNLLLNHAYFHLLFCPTIDWAKGLFIKYVTLKGGRGGISQCDGVYIKHTSVWVNV